MNVYDRVFGLVLEKRLEESLSSRVAGAGRALRTLFRGRTELGTNPETRRGSREPSSEVRSEQPRTRGEVGAEGSGGNVAARARLRRKIWTWQQQPLDPGEQGPRHSTMPSHLQMRGGKVVGRPPSTTSRFSRLRLTGKPSWTPPRSIER